MEKIYEEKIISFRQHLEFEEKSRSTVEKYIRDVNVFALWLGGKDFDKADVLRYKAFLSDRYAPASVNSIISSLNSFFSYMDWHDMKLKTIKIQRRIFAAEERELDKSEYEKLISASRMKNNERINLIIQTICSTGIRVSELKYISVEAVKNEKAEINCKGKLRVVFLPRQLCKALKIYVLKKNIKSGPVFVTKNGKPLHRSNIWNDMKKLGREAGIEESKIFPHNLRHLFARTFYGACRDIVRLADVLGHSSVNTTRIYTMESGENHRRQIQMLDLLRF